MTFLQSYLLLNLGFFIEFVEVVDDDWNGERYTENTAYGTNCKKGDTILRGRYHISQHFEIFSMQLKQNDNEAFPSALKALKTSQAAKRVFFGANKSFRWNNKKRLFCIDKR